MERVSNGDRANGSNGSHRAAVADYLRGDPGLPGSIPDGRLAVEPDGLRFTAPHGGLELGLDSILGLSISGRNATGGRRRRRIHGTMRVAGLSEGQPTEWIFAVDRSEAAELQSQLNHELAVRGREALPHVEELVGFPIHPLVTGEHPIVREGPPRPQDVVAAELGHALAAANGRRAKSRTRRILPWALLAAVLIIAEVAVPLILIHAN